MGCQRGVEEICKHIYCMSLNESSTSFWRFFETPSRAESTLNLNNVVYHCMPRNHWPLNWTVQSVNRWIRHQPAINYEYQFDGCSEWQQSRETNIVQTWHTLNDRRDAFKMWMSHLWSQVVCLKCEILIAAMATFTLADVTVWNARMHEQTSKRTMPMTNEFKTSQLIRSQWALRFAPIVVHKCTECYTHGPRQISTSLKRKRKLHYRKLMR